MQENISCFQYNSDDKSCYTFGNDSSRSNIQININSQVCFVNRTSTFHPETTTVNVFLSSPAITISTSVTGNNYYKKESIFLTNNAPLTYLSIVVIVPKTSTMYGPTSYTSFWSNTVSNIINDTDTNTMYIYQLNAGQIIVSGQWEIGSQFNLNGQARDSSNDTYTISTGSDPVISGHF